jgi:ADP-ribose pyrophosphatase YjhB (NUDIX family)
MPHEGNLVLIKANLGKEILLLHKLPENEADKLRKRKRIGIDCWGPPGGGNDATDKNVAHAARRETLEETGLDFPISAFYKIGMLEGFKQKETLELAWIVHIFTATAWPDMKDQIRFDPKEHDKIGWFTIDEIPWNQMIESDRRWMPHLIGDKPERLAIQVAFEGDSEKVLWCHMQEARFEN